MNQIEIQSVVPSSKEHPNLQQIQTWVDTTLKDVDRDTEIVIRIVGEEESAQLNEYYRQKQGPTNVLSFPFEMPSGLPDMPLTLLGDLVICAPVVEREAHCQHKKTEHHWAHMVVHGILHLLGYDHISDEEAELMESKEIQILKELKINNPYQHEA